MNRSYSNTKLNIIFSIFLISVFKHSKTVLSSSTIEFMWSYFSSLEMNCPHDVVVVVVVVAVVVVVVTAVAVVVVVVIDARFFDSLNLKSRPEL